MLVFVPLTYHLACVNIKSWLQSPKHTLPIKMYLLLIVSLWVTNTTSPGMKRVRLFRYALRSKYFYRIILLLLVYLLFTNMFNGYFFGYVKFIVITTK